MKVLALDFGGSSVKYAVVDENGKMEYRGKKPAPLDSPEQFVDTVNEIYEPVKDQVAGIGISLPGNIDPETRKAFHKWRVHPVVRLRNSRTDCKKMPRSRCG